MSAAAGSPLDKQDEQRAIGNVLSGAAEADGCAGPHPSGKKMGKAFLIFFPHFFYPASRSRGGFFPFFPGELSHQLPSPEANAAFAASNSMPFSGRGRSASDVRLDGGGWGGGGGSGESLIASPSPPVPLALPPLSSSFF